MRALLLIFVLAALLGLIVAHKRGRKGLSLPTAATALLALVLTLTFTLRPQQPSYVHRMEPFHRAVGYHLGQSIRAQVPDVTSILVLQDGRDQPNLTRFAAQQIEGLREGLGETGYELVPVNMADIQWERTRPPEEGIEREAVQSSYNKFKAVRDANPEAHTIVSFVGYPAYIRLLLRRDPTYHCFVWDLGTEESVNWESELAAGRVSARASYKLRPDMQASISKSTTLEEIFAMRYVLETAP